MKKQITIILRNLLIVIAVLVTIIGGNMTVNAEESDTQLSSALYPFDTTKDVLTRPGFDEQIVYSRDLNGILDIKVFALANEKYWIKNLYSGGNNIHYISVCSESGADFGSYSAEYNADKTIEKVEVARADGSIIAEALIDWTRINRATGLDMEKSDEFSLLETCIDRTQIDSDIEADTESIQIPDDIEVDTDNPQISEDNERSEASNYTIEFLPIEDYYVSDTQQRIYFNEIARYNPNGYFTVSADGATYPEVIFGENDVTNFLEFNVTEDKDFKVTIKYYLFGELIEEKVINIYAVVSAELPSKKYLFIGDSLTAASVMLEYFKNENPDAVTLYGSRGEAPYNHEGRGGWSTSDYLNELEKDGVTNPFYNPASETFDFSYYIDNNPSFADVDVVNIFLGRNDGFYESTITRIKTMIASIREYNENIIITVMGAYNVACNSTGTGKWLQSAPGFNNNAFAYNLMFYTEDFNIIPVHLNLDNEYDFASEERKVSIFDDRTYRAYTDNVHPSEIGYQKFGTVVDAYFKYYFAELG